MRTVISRSHAFRAEDLSHCASGGDTEVIAMGSSRKFCLVADGSCDFYPRTGPTMEWDGAAAHCILEEAGRNCSGSKCERVPLIPLEVERRFSDPI